MQQRHPIWEYEFIKRWQRGRALKNKPTQARGDFWTGLFFNKFIESRSLTNYIQISFLKDGLWIAAQRGVVA
jgi:hypothetical protein